MSQQEPNKIIYSMVGVSKSYNNQTVIQDISLSYFYGAKIGVIGLNGSGKSTLLRIMAGVDRDFEGEAHLTPGYTVGYLEQEPHLDESKTVREIVAGILEVREGEAGGIPELVQEVPLVLDLVLGQLHPAALCR